ncbi:Ribosomal RNA large subunit methyltransferase J [Symbiodinium microadriaticum]|uniref:Ribosomal RNA large subunit methyltransferase J n=1 Tax=Symbiodinium microadriaticum TaxID=2951 RepID=A0A1Q9CIJ4_SYMMI|nr:Ribosomal RNA large subunit methyltransferase J [Symbiodinium microadriaticum]
MNNTEEPQGMIACHIEYSMFEHTSTGLSWQKFVEISESETTEGKYGIPRFDGSLHLLQEYSYRADRRPQGPSVVKAIKEETLSTDKGGQRGSREGGILSRQYGEPMSTYILRRKTWYAMLTDLDSEIKLPELLLAEQVLMNVGVTEQHQMMVRTSLSQVISVDGVCNELINQHGSLHLREKRGPPAWRPRFGGKGAWKGKGGKGHQTYEDSAADYWDQGGEAYVSLGVFSAMLENGLDETYHQEFAEYAAEVVQTEAEERKARVTALKIRTTCRACGAKAHWSGDSVCPKGSGKGKPSDSSSSSTASTKGSGKSKSKDSGGKGGYQKPRTVYFAGRDDLHSEPRAYMAHRGDFTRVPPPIEMDARPATPTLPRTSFGWRGSTGHLVFTFELGRPARPPGTWPRLLLLRLRRRLWGLGLLLPPSSRRLWQLSAAASSNWSLVPGQDWDQEMLLQQENSDVVMDRLIRTRPGRRCRPRGPLQAVPLTGTSDLPLLRPLSTPPPGAPPKDENQSQIPEANVEPTGEEKDTVQAKGEDDKFKKPPCPHERTTTNGTNKYYFIKTCLKCNLVLERVKKESVEADTAAEGTRQHDQEKCPRKNVSRQHESSASATGYGALGGRNLEDPDTEAVKIMEMAGTVVMVQELEKLTGIVAKCAEIYRSKRPARSEPPKVQPAPALRTQAKFGSPAGEDRRGAPTRTDDAGITAETVLHSGKHNGKHFGHVYEEFLDYVSWILSQGGNIQAASLQNSERYIRGRKRREHQERQAYMALGAELPCSELLDYFRASDLDFEPLASPSSAASLNGIGGRVKALGKRTLSIAIQLADGSLATGVIQSTELEGSSAPLLLSYGAQRQLGFVLDVGAGTVYSKVFEQRVDLIDREGLPALRLLPLMPQKKPEHFAMAAEAIQPAEPDLEEDHPMEADEGDHWQQQGQAWMRVHLRPRSTLCDPRREPRDRDRGQGPLPSTNHTGERVELQGPWLRDTDYQETGGGETWTGYSLFFRDAVHCEQEREAEEELTLDTSCGFAAFDEEKPTVLTKGQRHLQDGSEGLQRHDATLWAQLDHLKRRDYLLLRPTGLMTSSRAIKERVPDACDGHHWHHPGAAQLPAKWSDNLAKRVLNAVLRELQELNCSVVFAAEEEAEELEEFGLMDGILGEEDLGEQLPPPIHSHQLGRDAVDPASKWLAIPRNKRLAIRKLQHDRPLFDNSYGAHAALGRDFGGSCGCLSLPGLFRKVICDAFEVVDAAGQKHTVLSLVDSGTKFHVAGLVASGGTPSSKSCAEFINTAWLSWAGPPAIFQVDQGVHNRGQVSSLMRSHGVEIRQAGRQAPWQIGRGERHGGILKAMVKRLVTAHQLSGESAISAAITQRRLPHDVTSLLGENETELFGTPTGDPAPGDRLWQDDADTPMIEGSPDERALPDGRPCLRSPAGALVRHDLACGRDLGSPGHHGGDPVEASVDYEAELDEAKRKYEDFLLGEEEDLPFEEETADFDGPTQVPYFDFVQPRPLVNDEAQREDAKGATETVTEVPQGPASADRLDGHVRSAMKFVKGRSEKRYRKKPVKQGAGRELNYQKADPELRKGLDASRQKEWSNWQKYTNMKKIFEEMKRQDSTLRVIPTRWVDTGKAEAGQPQKLKSRFVVRDDLEDSSSMRTDSPAGSQVAMGILLSYAAATRRTIKSGDISAAFLQGSELDRKLILSMPKDSPPEGMEEDDLVIVSTTVYGTKDAPRGWFKNVDTTLRGHQLRRLPLEPGLYVLNGHDQDCGNYVKGLLLVHVDDLLWVGDGDMEDVMKSVQQEYRELSRPDFTGQDLVEAKKTGEVRGQDQTPRHPLPGGQVGLQQALVAVQDASYAADYDTSASGRKLGYRSQSGRVLCLARREYLDTLEGFLYPIEWHSTVIRRVCKSTFQAESLSLQLGAVEAEHVRAVLHGLLEPNGKMNQSTEQEEEEEEEEQGGKGFSDKPYLAGGPEDCLKHVVLVSLLRHFVEDCRPFTFIDAHAGGGLYNLECDESQVFRNHEGGIAQVIDGVRDKTISDTVYRLMYAAMARLNIALGSHGFQHYLGSTAWALQWLRCQDQALLFELSAGATADLRRSLSILTTSEADIKLFQANSYEELVRNPPVCHQRQLILLDPPYDSARTYFTWNIYILWRLYNDRPKATLALWFPHYSDEQTEILLHRVQQLDLGEVLVAMMTLSRRSRQLLGSGLLVLRPPADLQDELLEVLPQLAHVLGAPGAAHVSVKLLLTAKNLSDGRWAKASDMADWAMGSPNGQGGVALVPVTDGPGGMAGCFGPPTCGAMPGICIIAAVWLPVQQQPQLQLPPRAFQAVSGTPKSSNVASLSIPHVSSPPVAPPELEAPGFKEVSAPPPPLQEPSLPLEHEDHLPSVGSAGHAEGACRPCAFVFKKGCDSGSQCTFCHLCPPGEKKRRMKEKSTKKATEVNLNLAASFVGRVCLPWNEHTVNSSEEGQQPPRTDEIRFVARHSAGRLLIEAVLSPRLSPVDSSEDENWRDFGQTYPFRVTRSQCDAFMDLRLIRLSGFLRVTDPTLYHVSMRPLFKVGPYLRWAVPVDFTLQAGAPFVKKVPSPWDPSLSHALLAELDQLNECSEDLVWTTIEDQIEPLSILRATVEVIAEHFPEEGPYVEVETPVGLVGRSVKVLKREAAKEAEFREARAKHEEEGWKEIKNLEGWTANSVHDAECLALVFDVRRIAFTGRDPSVVESMYEFLQIYNLPGIEGLSQLKSLNTLTIQKNKIGFAGVEDVVHLVDTTISTLDLQDNKIWDPDILPEVFTRMADLRVLYLKGNPCAKKIPNYRKGITAVCILMTDQSFLRTGELQMHSIAEILAGLEEERAERRRIKEEENSKHERNMKAFQEMIESVRREKRERDAMRVEDKFTDTTDPVVTTEQRMQQQAGSESVAMLDQENAEDIKDDAREHAERCLQSEKEARSEQGSQTAMENPMPPVGGLARLWVAPACDSLALQHGGERNSKEECQEEVQAQQAGDGGNVDKRKLVYEVRVVSEQVFFLMGAIAQDAHEKRWRDLAPKKHLPRWLEC